MTDDFLVFRRLRRAVDFGWESEVGMYFGDALIDRFRRWMGNDTLVLHTKAEVLAVIDRAIERVKRDP